MKKIRLDVDTLDVVSFATSGEPGEPRGTVHGRDSLDCTFTLGRHASCYDLCNTQEYDTCHEAGPSVGPSCDYYCQVPSLGC